MSLGSWEIDWCLNSGSSGWVSGAICCCVGSMSPTKECEQGQPSREVRGAQRFPRLPDCSSVAKGQGRCHRALDCYKREAKKSEVIS